MPKNGQYVYSGDEERYASDGYDTRTDAIRAAEDEGLVSFYTGRVVLMTVKDLVDINGHDVLDRIDEAAFERCGEVAEDAMGHVEAAQTLDLETRLNAAAAEWAEANNIKINCYAVEDVEHHSTT